MYLVNWPESRSITSSHITAHCTSLLKYLWILRPRRAIRSWSLVFSQYNFLCYPCTKPGNLMEVNLLEDAQPWSVGSRAFLQWLLILMTCAPICWKITFLIWTTLAFTSHLQTRLSIWYLSPVGSSYNLLQSNHLDILSELKCFNLLLYIFLSSESFVFAPFLISLHP